MIKSIQIYVAGCPRSLITEPNLKQAVKELGINVEVETIDNADIRREHGVSATPTIRINGEKKSEGVFCSVDDCKEILSEYLDK